MITEDVAEFLKNVPPFQFLDGATLNEIASSLTMEFYPRDAVILKQDGSPSDHLRIIKKGGVKVSIKIDNKEEVVVDYRGEGDTFGLWSLIEKSRQKTTVVAIDDTICYLLPRDKVQHLLDTNAVFTEYFLKSHLSKYVDKTYGEMVNKSAFFGGTDRILFTTQIGEISIKDIVTVEENVPIQEAARSMAAKKISSLIVTDQGGFPTGIVTDRDLREKVVATGRNVREPVKNIMSLPLIRVDARDYCFEAILKMIRHNIHHILVVKDGALNGVLTNHDLMLLQGGSPLTFAKDIENQQSVDGLVPVSLKINRIVKLLLKEGAKASNITKIISELNDRLVKKVLELAEKQFGPAPLPYCWIVFGSEGRKEQTFKTDQDNAIIFANPVNEEQVTAARAYFAQFAEYVRDSLFKCGFPPCEAGYMAATPKWCQPLSVWEGYFQSWINTPNPDAILRSLIFFDFRPLYGEIMLADSLRGYLKSQLRNQNIFFAKMAGVAVSNRPPLGFFKSFVVEKSGEHKNTLNLKIRGIGPLIDLVRLFALEEGVTETSTLDRIKAMKDSHPIIIELGEELEQAFEFINMLRIHHQLEQIEKNVPLDNFIDPSSLSNLERKSLKESFQLIMKIQDAMTELYAPGMVGQ
ncbi:MAG: DUF294 nucleotidyltransferase-like domain-containing protein [Thermodesulfovibrionales bacterium]